MELLEAEVAGKQRAAEAATTEAKHLRSSLEAKSAALEQVTAQSLRLQKLLKEGGGGGGGDDSAWKILQVRCGQG